ncbi:dephospho-CoA kinase [Galbibacter marinus]|uniref:Dephospho-CoA kinase n=1 Tax=Galbibacter marinus TaxID=555500 RepID=K2PU63_9FLAO|nr:dephospho-CoA kinase [Galbibacter marinus]EKF56195.1 dephospho-CoA kinase [Galbibacter marinus]
MIVGLTGGIGSGKSTIASFFKQLGVPVYIADERAKRLMEIDETIKRRIVEEFGAQAYENSIPNRALIAQIVFNNPSKLAVLNGIIHPAVREDFDSWYQVQDAPYVIKEVAILFESGGDILCDAVISVTAPEEVRIQRVLNRDNTTRKAVMDRIKNQWTDKQRVEKSTYVIENIDLDSTRENVYKIHDHILKKTI